MVIQKIIYIPITCVKNYIIVNLWNEYELLFQEKKKTKYIQDYHQLCCINPQNRVIMKCN